MSDEPKDTRFSRPPEAGPISNGSDEALRKTSEFALPPAAKAPSSSSPAQAEPYAAESEQSSIDARALVQEPAPEPIYETYQEADQERIYAQSPHEALQPDEVIPPPLRSKKARGILVRFFNFLMTIAFVGAVLFVAGIWYGKTQFEAKGPLADPVTFVVPKGASFVSIIPGLEAKNIISKQGIMRVFKNGVSSSGNASKLKAGEFAFTPGMSMREVMTQLTEGRAINYSLTFPEGWTSYQMMQRIAADTDLVGDMPAIPLEGSMLPNTYSFEKGMTRAQFVQLLKDAHQKTVRDIWNNRVDGLPLKSAEEMVILASIVEKETGISNERAHVASVFVNRLRKRMRLQTDPTVIYGIWGGEGKPKGRGGLRRSELDRKTPYNTYQISGLPPGPIANPGIESLRAVANPAITDDLFFVADGTGGHAFAATLKQHNINVAKWRKIEAQLKKEAEAAKAAKEEENSSGTGGN